MLRPTDIATTGSATTGSGGSALPGAASWALDVSDPAAIETVVAEIVERLGPVDVLVNNAGVSVPAPIGADDYWRAWDATMAVNLAAYVRMVRACLPSLTRDPGGRVVNIASTEGLGATPYISPVHGVEARRRRPHPVARVRARPAGRHGELRVPRPDPTPG